MKLTFTEKTIIDIVNKNIVKISTMGVPYYLDVKGGFTTYSVCSVVFQNNRISFTGPKHTVKKIANECGLETEKNNNESGFWYIFIPLKKFPTLALLSKVSMKILL